jgi:carboxylesterase type B
LLIGTTAEEVNATFLAAADKIDEERLARRLARLKLDGDRIRGYRASMPEAQPWQVLAQATTDSMFRAPAGRLADARADAAGRSVVGDPASTFAYEYRWRSPARGGLGACHCLDLPFVFDVLDADGVRGVLGADPPQHLADTMHRAWVDFITTGDPGWEPYGALRRPTMAFDDECFVVTDPLKVARDTFG